MRVLAPALALVCSCSSPPSERVTTDPGEQRAAGARTEKPTLVPISEPAKSPPTNFVSDRERTAALGKLVGLDRDARIAFAPGDFEPLPMPKPGEWLAEHRERGQSFPDFVEGRHVRPDDRRRVLYIQPIGKLSSGSTPKASDLVRFSKAYFDIETKILPTLDSKQLFGLRWRRRTTGTQLLAGSVLDLLKKRLPDDAFLMLAVTGHDLYPADDWNFVFGMATFRERVGVYSTARYDPSFYGVKIGVPAYDSIILRRTLNIMAHEIGHMYGLEHCVHYRCAMNGSNSLAETDRSPIHLCPVCLRKLRHGAGFDIVDRYEKLERLYRKSDLVEEADWLRERLKRFDLPDPPTETE